MPEVARDHPFGHIGSTPQGVDGIVAGGRVAGMLADFDEHLEPKTRVDAYLPLPPPAQDAGPGYFREENLPIQVDDAVARADLGKQQVPTAKTLGGYDFGDS